MAKRTWKTPAAQIGIRTRTRTRSRIRIPVLISILVPLLIGLICFSFSAAAAQVSSEQSLENDFSSLLKTFSSFGDRTTGTSGYASARDFIFKRLNELELGEVRTHLFGVPVLSHDGGTLTISDTGVSIPIHPIRGNAITPQTIGPPGLDAPLIYVGKGELSDFNGKKIDGAVVIMELDSGKNWLNAASHGAKGLIYVDREITANTFFQEKVELSPIHFPRFWMKASTAAELFGEFEKAPGGVVSERVTLLSETRWKNAVGANIYCLVEGTDPQLKEELIIVEAFYDTTSHVMGIAPGADEACGIATLLSHAQGLKQHPPGRSVLLVATAGHAQTLAGMREAIWSIRTRSSFQRDMKRDLKKRISQGKKLIRLLEAAEFKDGVLILPETDETDETGKTDQAEKLIREAVSDRIKTEVDQIARRLMRLRMEKETSEKEKLIRKLADERFMLRRLGWRNDYKNLSIEEIDAIKQIIPLALEDHKAIYKDAKQQEKMLKSARAFRSVVKIRELAGVVSLHLSSHGDGVGAFNYGWLYPFRPRINRVAAYSVMDNVLQTAASESEFGSLYRDTLRPSRLRTWQSYFLDKPPLGGEVSALAGYHGITLATVNDARPGWGTPYDTMESVDIARAVKQSILVGDLIDSLTRAPKLNNEEYPRDGFSMISARGRFIRHGELFPDQPAPGTVILAFQGPGIFHAIVDAMGNFQLRGMADKKHSYHKVIIEGYKFEPETGKIQWAIDKPGTGKDAYRVKMNRPYMETNLIFFACESTTVFNLLEPRTFDYMTKIQLIDGRREAAPQKYWYSRIDTRTSTIASIYLEPGTPLKMILSDSILNKKFILTNASPENPQGIGYRPDDWPFIFHTNYMVARDMWQLLAPRIENLEKRGIVDEKIRALQKEGVSALDNAKTALEKYRYDRFAEVSARSWALASRVYNQVEKTQKDVLFGVLFYIALFVPFAFCAERLLFSFANIYKRIISFLTILLILIFVIYQVHPAFRLAYSPMVVILAFFIIGLSFMVSLIIFFRFEEEMINLQKRAWNTRGQELSKWKAFVSAFFLGVSNLRRRRLRTFLTCMTLVILTFTIMSFTSVKSSRQLGRLMLKKDSSYRGFLLKNVNWTDLPPEALGIISNSFRNRGVVVPRAWLEAEDRTRAEKIPVRLGNAGYDAQGLVGLSAREGEVSGLDEILVGGRWFTEDESRAVLIPDRMAQTLGIDPKKPDNTAIKLWGKEFRVVGVFSGDKLQEQVDLDGEPLTPVTFPRESGESELTELEADALNSGEDVKAFQSLYTHISGDLTLIIPYRTLMAAGGHLKAMAIHSTAREDLSDTARHLEDRFGLTLFSGESDGTFMYHASNTLSYSGVPNIIIPMIISVFIVLNTMIGSVYERKREIGIYTSVGLAPSHVSFLFVAEAMALGVLSVVMGYLVAQTSAGLFAGTSLWKGITVNYSSMAGVAAMFLVMLVVLISVIYPSKVAANIAIPDVKRAWKLPRAKGNVMEVDFPFLMKYHEHRSIAGFIHDYFKAHRDVSHGLFSAGELAFASICPISHHFSPSKHECKENSNDACQNVCLNIRAKVWLAPFDLGILEHVDVRFCPSREEPGYLEINVNLRRESGEANAWRRINKGFLNELRKQLLIWRGFEPEKKRHYQQVLLDAQQEARDSTQKNSNESNSGEPV